MPSPITSKTLRFRVESAKRDKNAAWTGIQSDVAADGAEGTGTVDDMDTSMEDVAPAPDFRAPLTTSRSKARQSAGSRRSSRSSTGSKKRTPSPLKVDPPPKKKQTPVQARDELDKDEAAPIDQILLLKSNATHTYTERRELSIAASQTLNANTMLTVNARAKIRSLLNDAQSKQSVAILSWRRGGQPAVCFRAKKSKSHTIWSQDPATLRDMRTKACPRCTTPYSNYPTMPCIVYAVVDGEKKLVLLPDDNKRYDYFTI